LCWNLIQRGGRGDGAQHRDCQNDDSVHAVILAL
jgi:hypothetical protein